VGLRGVSAAALSGRARADRGGEGATMAPTIYPCPGCGVEFARAEMERCEGCDFWHCSACLVTHGHDRMCRRCWADVGRVEG
jgi:hypothetical protein